MVRGSNTDWDGFFLTYRSAFGLAETWKGGCDRGYFRAILSLIVYALWRRMDVMGAGDLCDRMIAAVGMSPFAAFRPSIACDIFGVDAIFFFSLVVIFGVFSFSLFLFFFGVGVSLGSFLVALGFRDLAVLIWGSWAFCFRPFVVYFWSLGFRLWLASAPLLWSITHRTIVPNGDRCIDRDQRKFARCRRFS